MLRPAISYHFVTMCSIVEIHNSFHSTFHSTSCTLAQHFSKGQSPPLQDPNFILRTGKEQLLHAHRHCISESMSPPTVFASLEIQTALSSYLHHPTSWIVLLWVQSFTVRESSTPEWPAPACNSHPGCSPGIFWACREDLTWKSPNQIFMSTVKR